MSDHNATNVFELAIQPRNDEYQPDDDRWRDQVASLYRELDEQVDTEQRSVAVPGTKGSIDQIVIALGGAGVFYGDGRMPACLARSRPGPQH